VKNVVEKSIPTRPSWAAATRREYKMNLNADADVVFPLLCPTQEYAWIPDWSCELLRSESGFVESGCVFRSAMNGRETLWCVAEFNPNNKTIVFVQFVSGDLVNRITLRLAEVSHQRSILTWFFEHTAVSERGSEALISGQLDEEVRNTMSALEHFLNEYLERVTV